MNIVIVWFRNDAQKFIEHELLSRFLLVKNEEQQKRKVKDFRWSSKKFMLSTSDQRISSKIKSDKIENQRLITTFQSNHDDANISSDSRYMCYLERAKKTEQFANNTHSAYEQLFQIAQSHIYSTKSSSEQASYNMQISNDQAVNLITECTITFIDTDNLSDHISISSLQITDYFSTSRRNVETTVDHDNYWIIEMRDIFQNESENINISAYDLLFLNSENQIILNLDQHMSQTIMSMNFRITSNTNHNKNARYVSHS